jgi:hypothetical protein
MSRLSYDAVYADLEMQISDIAPVRADDTVILVKPAGATEAQYSQATSELGFNRTQERARRL